MAVISFSTSVMGWSLPAGTGLPGKRDVALLLEKLFFSSSFLTDVFGGRGNMAAYL